MPIHDNQTLQHPSIPESMVVVGCVSVCRCMGIRGGDEMTAEKLFVCDERLVFQAFIASVGTVYSSCLSARP
jgi:hypothetical protein